MFISSRQVVESRHFARMVLFWSPRISEGLLSALECVFRACPTSRRSIAVYPPAPALQSLIERRIQGTFSQQSKDFHTTPIRKPLQARVLVWLIGSL